MLGAVLLSREALGAVSEKGLRYDDFYKPAHQHIYRRRPSPCTRPAARSTRSPSPTSCAVPGCSSQVGGAEALHALQNATPAISNAAHYAQIVQDTAMLRRLIMVAGDIAEIGLQRARRRHQGHRRGRVEGVQGRRAAGQQHLRRDRRADEGGDGAARGELRPRRHHHRHRHRLPRPRRAAVGAAALDAEHHRRPPGDGQDRVRAWAWRRTSPRRRGGRCSCSRSRWATSS